MISLYDQICCQGTLSLSAQHIVAIKAQWVGADTTEHTMLANCAIGCTRLISDYSRMCAGGCSCSGHRGGIS